MSLINKFFYDIINHGFVYTVNHIKLKAKKIADKLIRYFVMGITKKVPLQKVIIIESHNDFDCNGGAIYEYLVRNNYNAKYKLVWLLKNKAPSVLPHNVFAYNIYAPSVRKNYYICTASFFFSDDIVTDKVRQEQVSVYCTHGGCTFKNVRGMIVVPESVDFILSSSRQYDPFMCDNYSIPYPNKKMLHFGFPSNDIFFHLESNEFLKVRPQKYDHYFLWMPTFRKGGGVDRNDSNAEFKYEIPLIEEIQQLEELNSIFKESNSLLVIKLHPMQKIDYAKLPREMSNICILDGLKTKEIGVDNYFMMASSDAFISDYSSAAYSYLLLDRPIGFIICDINEYKVGFTVDNIYDYLPGALIKNFDDFKKFFDDFFKGNDEYSTQRKQMASWMYQYRDGNSCERILNYLKI